MANGDIYTSDEAGEVLERIYKRYGNNLGAFFDDAMKDAKRRADRRTRKARLVVMERKLGFHNYFLVDEFGRLLNTEPVCSVPDKYHQWFDKFLEGLVFERDGLPVDAIDVQPTSAGSGDANG